ncbi:hypothetical protein CU044_0946 [Streptomyces sp. L-9-10]|uniref:hypothetical protein n=1 Tax=unclassified Streptomyces TaxID=2593676 RepID=UPI00101D215D|nr:hypothetical protein [Streptomyces sp. L-9-10]RYJ30603.1 hypothetical protein CU044_0946 [Streptomyces sp. L-9-10]
MAVEEEAFPAAEEFRAGLLRAVERTAVSCRSAGDESEETMARLLAEALAAEPVWGSGSGRRVIEEHGPLIREAVTVLLRAGVGGVDRGTAEEWVRRAAGFLAGAAAGPAAVGSAAARPAAGHGYVSPALGGPAHTGSGLVVHRDAADRLPAGPVRDGDPRAAAHRRARRSERALRDARRILDGLDRTAIDAANARLMRSLGAGERVRLVWVGSRELLLLGGRGPAFADVAALHGMPEARISVGFLQLLRRPGPFGRFGRPGQVEVMGVPEDEEEPLRDAFRRHRTGVALVPASRWAD